MNEARPAVQLAWPYQQVNIAPSLATLINVRCRMAKGRAAAITTEVDPAGVVGHQHDDVGFLVRRLAGSDALKSAAVAISSDKPLWIKFRFIFVSSLFGFGS